MKMPRALAIALDKKIGDFKAYIGKTSVPREDFRARPGPRVLRGGPIWSPSAVPSWRHHDERGGAVGRAPHCRVAPRGRGCIDAQQGGSVATGRRLECNQDGEWRPRRYIGDSSVPERRYIGESSLCCLIGTTLSTYAFLLM